MYTVNEHQLAQGKDLHQRTGNTFYYATRLLPKRIREQTYILYGFFRIADEIVDGESDETVETKQSRLDDIQAQALGKRPASEPVIAAFAELQKTEEIPADEVRMFLDAMRQDIEKTRYESYDELAGYTRGSAMAVGNMMLAIMDTADSDARAHAMALGEAFQLTNFLRDVREDLLELDRVYLPQATLAEHGVSIELLQTMECTPEFTDAIRTELQRAETRYREGVAGIEQLPTDCQFPVLLAATLYAEHHRLIRKQNYDVLSSRPTLTRRRKLVIVAKTWWHWRRLRDPVAVFNRVSAVSDETHRETATELDDRRLVSSD